MTRSIKALGSAAILAALALPAVASAQDTSSTGGRVTRDSASGRNASGMNRVRFDTAQAVTLTGVTIARIDSTGASAAPAMPERGVGSGRSLTAIVRSGTDSMQVVLGPSAYLASKQLTLLAGDVINVKGVRRDAGAAGVGAGMSSAAATIGTTPTSAAMTTILATEVGKGTTTVQLRDKSTGEPSWGTMGSDAAKSRGSMMAPPASKDTSSITPPVRKP